MARQITVITPENIPLTLEPAGIGTRFGALLIDMLIQIGITIAVIIIGAITAGLLQATGIETAGSVLMIIASFLIWFGYFVLFEAIWQGQTPGKRAFGLRVVRDGGYPIDFFSSATRNLIRIADFLPISYTAGALSVFFQPNYKRLGDIVAGTIVVKERKVDPLTAFRTRPLDAAVGPMPTIRRAPFTVLTSAELSILRRFALRRSEMTPDDSERLAYRIIAPLVSRLDILFPADTPPRYSHLATEIVRIADGQESAARAAV